MARLKVFVFDHDAAGAKPARPRPRSLQRQGDMLLRALLADLGALAGVEVVTAASLDVAGPRAGACGIACGPACAAACGGARHAACDAAGVAKYGAEYGTARMAGHGGPDGVVADGQPAGTDVDEGSGCALRQQVAPATAPGTRRFGVRFAAGLQAADAVWPLAGESDGVLACLSRAILHGGRTLLGSAPGAVEVAASKLRLARVLADGGVAAVATYSPHAALPEDGGPWVVKPDDGAGCLDTRLFGDRAAALAWIRASAAEGYVLQPFVAGKLGSLSLICCDGVAQVLACNRERVAMRDNRFHFMGSIVNGLADDDGTLARLAQQVAAAIPSLWGYVGVDFVLTARGAVVLDVNPRLTAAYAGLHASIGRNPAGLVLALLDGPAVLPAVVGVRRAVSVDVGMA
ncbi:ATP-grasp domain-containing protein [uncultured Massilia sp.]|uniref:ATP-grasp domain-containing protein n=1 Tax=uncultured Massilia sp. TaxID=169973 RepID=UPI002600395D|nr:ATP-grasp domain-containing protein [uncultured Massilia sp.]